MKTRTLILVVFLVASSAALARLLQWSPAERPKLSLDEAYTCATTALGKQSNEFYCVRAECIISRSPNGEWLFTFGSKRGDLKSAFVFFDKKTQVVDGLPAF